METHAPKDLKQTIVTKLEDMAWNALMGFSSLGLYFSKISSSKCKAESSNNLDTASFPRTFDERFRGVPLDDFK